MDLEHKSQRKTSRSEKREKRRKKERENKQIVVQDIPPENDPQ